MNRYKDEDSALRTVDPQTGEPIPPRQQPGYYAGFSTLSQSPFWDEATRQTVSERVQSPPVRHFFDEEEYKFWVAVFDHLIPQTDRTFDRRIPLVGSLDQRLHENRAGGYRYEDMPPDRDAYQLGRKAIDAEAEQRYGGAFLFLGHWQQEKVLQAIHDGRPQAALEIWRQMSVTRFWQMLMGDALEAYYGHPWAWDEIGFGGPAYPRAYTRLENGEPEPWEVRETRYQWRAPDLSVSDELEPLHHLDTEAQQRRHVRQIRKQS